MNRNRKRVRPRPRLVSTIAAGLKVCGECDGRGRLGRRRCHACIGTGKYSYDEAGNRVAWRGGVGWCRT